MTFHWPQITLVAIMILGLGVNLAKHGETTEETHNFWIGVACAAVIFTLLYFGGFFG